MSACSSQRPTLLASPTSRATRLKHQPGTLDRRSAPRAGLVSAMRPCLDAVGTPVVTRSRPPTCAGRRWPSPSNRFRSSVGCFPTECTGAGRLTTDREGSCAPKGILISAERRPQAVATKRATCANGDIRNSPWPVIRVRIEEVRGSIPRSSTTFGGRHGEFVPGRDGHKVVANGRGRSDPDEPIQLPQRSGPSTMSAQRRGNAGFRPAELSSSGCLRCSAADQVLPFRLPKPCVLAPRRSRLDATDRSDDAPRW